MKTKKALSLFLALALALTFSLFSFAACGKSELSQIKVTATPDKVAYIEDETLDLTGLEVTAVYSNGKEQPVTDYKTTPAQGAALKTGNKSVLITYAEDGVTKTTSFPITVTNDIVSVEKLSDPAKLSYMPGELFDPSGMQVKVTYENGKSDTKEVKDLSDVEYSVSGMLTTEDTSIDISYAGQKWTYTLTYLPKLMMEAENGTLSSAAGRVYNDAVKNDTQQGVWDDKYLASGNAYIGGLASGDSITQIFDADKTGTGKLTLRMASQRITETSESWTPIFVSDAPLNELCDIYVNGEKIEIPQEAILPGGGESGGQPNFYLYFNWEYVSLENVNFVAGRNVITVRVHEPVNFDYMTLEGTDSVLNPYISDTEIEYSVNSLKVEAVEIPAEEEQPETTRVMLTIDGQISGAEGYLGDLLNFDMGAAVVPEITIDGNTFSIKADITDIELGTYTPTLSGASIDAGENITAQEIQLGYNYYSVAISDKNTVQIVIDSDYKVTINSATIDEPVITFEERDGRAVLVIGNGVADYTVEGYTEEEAKAAVEDKIRQLFYFDIQENGGSWLYPLGTNFHTVNLLEDNKFEVVADITDARTHEYDLMIHFAHANEDGSFPEPGGNLLDYTPDVDPFNIKLTINGVEYNCIYDKENCWGLIYFKIYEKDAPSYSFTGATLETTEDKVYLIIEGKYENYTIEQVEAFNFYFDLQENPYYMTGSWEGSWVRYSYTPEVTAQADGTFTLKMDVTSLPEYAYTGHIEKDRTTGGDEEPVPPDCKIDAAIDTKVTVGGKEYNLISVPGSIDGNEFWGCLGLVVKTAA